MQATALIAEDEPLLALALKAELGRAWPALRIVDTVGDGRAAVAQALALRPDILFFDIRMPGQDGLEAAAELVDAWPTDAAVFPLLVFVTAYDQYALQAFDVQAVDYVLKPVQAARLQKTVQKLQERLSSIQKFAIDSGENAQPTADTVAAPGLPHGPGVSPQQHLQQTLGQLRHLLDGLGPQGPQSRPGGQVGGGHHSLRVIQASVGTQIRMVPVEEVLYFEAADKYLRVVCASQEYLIRTPLKDLLPQLSADSFWQIHRGTVVRADAIDSVRRDDNGKLSLSLRGRPEKLAVSRLYAHIFKAM